MKYVLNVIQFLSMAVAAASLCIFIYFSIRAQIMYRSSFILLSLFLFALTIIISGLTAILRESIRDDKSKQQIFAKIIRNINELKNAKANQPITHSQLQAHRNNTNDEIHFQSLLKELQSLELKLDNYTQNSSDQSVLLSSTLSNLDKHISAKDQDAGEKNFSLLADDIYNLKNHIEKLETKITDMTTAARMANAFDTEKYAKPQEEASYPESVMNLTDTQPEDQQNTILKNEKEDVSLQDTSDLTDSINPVSLDSEIDLANDFATPSDDIASDRLKDIFNDQFAAEIADLDIMNDKPQPETNDQSQLVSQTQDINLNDFLK